jgi:hypothetical protein
MLNHTCFIYEITNIISNKKYIGSHIGSEADTYNMYSTDLSKDIKKLGNTNFITQILEYVKNVHELAKIETKWLLTVDAKNNPNYYNKSNYAGIKFRQPKQKDRGVCPVCKKKPVAIANVRNNVTYYRKKCDSCYRKKRKPAVAGWIRAGYKRKDKCEKCGFRFKYVEQAEVVHINGDISDTNWVNLKTICLNCIIDVQHSVLPWKLASILPD